MKNPNALAWLVLYAWPVVVFGGYALRRSTARVARTTAWMMILPVMFLPAGIKLPFAGLDKHRIAVLSVAVALYLFHRRELALRDSWRRFPLVALAVFCLAALLTYRTNTDALRFGVLELRGLGPRDIPWMIYEPFVEFVLPFAIGQRVFRTERDVRDLLRVLTACALIYAPLCLIEMRLSPQFSNWIYGYFPHSFGQMVRGGGYRPIVFMSHGLSVGMFMFAGLCAALTLRRAGAAPRARYTKRSVVTGAILLLAKNLASLVYSAVALPLLLWTSARTKARVVLALALVVVTYPTLRAVDIFPTADLAALFRQISPERTRSLAYRFDNEDKLVARAMERPLFGWGGWGRSRVYKSWGEPDEAWAGAKDVSTTDGSWIIWLGISGAVGFAARLAMLVVPLFRFAWNRRELSPGAQAVGAGLAVMTVLASVDLLPNSLWDSLPVMYAGMLFTLSATRASKQRPLNRRDALWPSAQPADDDGAVQAGP